MQLLNKADSYYGSEGYVTLESLRYNFQSYIWRPLHEERSPLVDFFLSPVFAPPKDAKPG
jgi:hypothetical protein